MIYLFLSLLLCSNQEGVNQIKKNKYVIEDLSGFNPEIIKHRKVDSIQIIYIHGKDSLLSSVLKFNADGFNTEKAEFLPNESLNARTVYLWDKNTLKSQTNTFYFNGKIDQVTKIEYDYTFPKIISRTRNRNQKVTSVKVKEYDIKDSLLVHEINYSVEKGVKRFSTTASYSYTADGNIIIKYYDEKKELGLTTINEKSKYIDAVSVFDILPDGEIENMKILFYDKEGQLIKIMTNRNSTSSVVTQNYKHGLLHEVSTSTGKYIYQYVFRKN